VPNIVGGDRVSHRLHITITESQRHVLSRAADETSLSVAELVRRAIDEKYPDWDDSPNLDEFTVAVWRRSPPERPRYRSGIRLD
jgi:hypothetical protein